MKSLLTRYALAVSALCLMAAIAIASSLPRDDNSAPVQSFAPKAFGIYSSTKAPLTINASGLLGVKVQTTNNVTVYLGSTSSAGFPQTKDVATEYAFASSASKIIFQAASSASTAKTKFYIQYR